MFYEFWPFVRLSGLDRGEKQCISGTGNVVPVDAILRFAGFALSYRVN